MTDENLPFTAAVSEYTVDHPTATPIEIMESVGVDEQHREQVKYYCAVTWDFRYGGNEGCEIPSDVRPDTVEWNDVADWDVPESEEVSSDG